MRTRSAIASIAFALAGCGTGALQRDAMESTPRVGAGQESWMVQADRTIIRNASMTVDAPDVLAAMGETERIVAAAGGRVTRTSRYSANASMTLRVPDAKLYATLDSVGALGKVVQRGVSAEDVTAEVIDLDARVKALTTSRDRLRALHDRTNTVEEIIAVERELARVQGELDSIQGRLTQLRTDASYSTVQLSLRRTQVLGPLGVVFYGAGKLIAKLFVWR